MVWSGAEGSANAYPGWWASSGAYTYPAPPKMPEHYKEHYTKSKPPPKKQRRWSHWDEDWDASPCSNHQTLGLKRSASQEEIRAAYLCKARQTHPDKGGEAKEFIKIKRAYDCLIQ